jgi:hypothetical protein
MVSVGAGAKCVNGADNGIAIGRDAQSNGAGAVAIGHGATAAAGTLVIGAQAYFSTASVGCGSWTYTSDSRLKKDIVDLNDAMRVIRKIKTKSYKTIKHDKKEYGVLAQDLLGDDDLDFMVSTIQHKNDQGVVEEHYGVSYQNIDIMAIRAIQEIDDVLKTLARDFNLLENRVRALENRP